MQFALWMLAIWAELSACAGGSHTDMLAVKEGVIERLKQGFVVADLAPLLHTIASTPLAAALSKLAVRPDACCRAGHVQASTRPDTPWALGPSRTKYRSVQQYPILNKKRPPQMLLGPSSLHVIEPRQQILHNTSLGFRPGP